MKRGNRRPLSLDIEPLVSDAEARASDGADFEIAPPPESARIRSAILADPVPQKASPEASPAQAAFEALGRPRPSDPVFDARQPTHPPHPARFAYWVATTCALLWAGSLVAYFVGFGRLGPFDYAPFRYGVIAALAVLPALFMLLFAYAVRQGAKLGEDVRTTRKLADDLVGPVALAAAQTGGLMQAVRGEIERASQAAEVASEKLAALRDGLSEESRRITQAALEAQSSAHALALALGKERGDLESLSAGLELRTSEITEAVGRQSRLAADVSDLAQAQLAEAQAALAARAADLSAAAADARDGAEAAASALAQETDRLGTASDGMSDRLSRLGVELARERDRLATLTDALRGDHEDLSARAESQHARLAEIGETVRDQGIVAATAAADAADALRLLVAEAAEQVRATAAGAAQARTDAVADAQGDLERFTESVRVQREQTAADAAQAAAALTAAAEHAHAAAAARLGELEGQAERVGEAALERIEQLGEAAFAAGQRADQAFDTRIAAAKRAIDQSAAAVEAAGLRSAQRIEGGLAAARAALAELDALLTEVDGRFETLPAEAMKRADAVRFAVEQGVGDLTAAARRAAEETQAIDEAFQERVRRNYDTLSEAVRLMGRVAGAVDAAARAPDSNAAPVARPAPLADVQPLDLSARDLAPAVAPTTEPQALERPLPIAVGDSHARYSPGPSNAQAAPPESARMFLRSLGDDAPTQGSAWDGGAADLFAPPAPVPAAAEAAGLRPRLRLTPTDATAPSAPIRVSHLEPTVATDREPASGSAARNWGWKDLLAGLPGETAPEPADDVDEEALADRLIGEIEALGLDAVALLPRSQVDDLAHGLQEGRGSGVREGVRRLAPAAVRRLSRRVLTDTVLRRDADRFVRRYSALLEDAARRDRDGFLSTALLGSDAGRAYLLLDAAIGDLAA